MKPCDEEPLAPNNPKVSMQVAAAPCHVGLLPEHCRPVQPAGGPASPVTSCTGLEPHV